MYIPCIRLNEIEKERNENCTNVAATTHKSFHTINIIKVIVTTLSVSNCFFVVQIHTHVDLRACECVRVFNRKPIPLNPHKLS